MAERILPVKGTRVLLPPASDVWAAVEATARRVFATYGFGEIRTPIVEHTELFVRSVGETSDIVGKEMYSFEDRKGRRLSLRPEGTAPVVRAFVDEGLATGALPQRLYYIGPYFRYERPQRGRYRQFHQIGAEILGDPGPLSDAELIAMLMRFLGELGHEGLTVLINTVGDTASRKRFRQALVDYLAPHHDSLSEASRQRLDTNPLRILDSKSRADREILAGAPRLEEHLSDGSRRHFEAVLGSLESRGIAVERSPHLVRGLDYYTRTVFEIVSSDLGAQDAIVGGGRYDGLVGELGGPDLPAIGFAIGQDRLIETLPPGFAEAHAAERGVMLVPIGDDCAGPAFDLAERLRDAGCAVVLESPDRGLKKSMRLADRLDLRRILLLGEDELAISSVTLRDLATGEQETIGLDEVISRLGTISRSGAETAPGDSP